MTSTYPYRTTGAHLLSESAGLSAERGRDVEGREEHAPAPGRRVFEGQWRGVARAGAAELEGYVTVTRVFMSLRGLLLECIVAGKVSRFSAAFVVSWCKAALPVEQEGRGAADRRHSLSSRALAFRAVARDYF
jgi:hypothetical protein